ncbi:hypothetical protein BACI71_70009 [Bacillus mycoides]|uniref:Uncharacterized protein n=1 Tax=Bacillus mycoides TaxID=1405 RepID=A0A654AVA6_BACMY|nr:hypothetical protein BACI71_70009 [Bacillus mycoides]
MPDTIIKAEIPKLRGFGFLSSFEYLSFSFMYFDRIDTHQHICA